MGNELFINSHKLRPLAFKNDIQGLAIWFSTACQGHVWTLQADTIHHVAKSRSCA
jgi:hypothetical protein